MAVEIERYIVELGAEGRLIEMQLEEMLTGVAADRSALVKDYLVDADEEAFSAVMESLPRLPNQDLLDFGRLGELMGYDRKLNTLDFPVTPRGHRILGRVPRLPELVVDSVVREFGSFDVMLGGERRRAGGRRGRRRAARKGDPRGAAEPPGDQPRGQVFADIEPGERWPCRPPRPFRQLRNRQHHRGGHHSPGSINRERVERLERTERVDRDRGDPDQLQGRGQGGVPASRRRQGPEEGEEGDPRRAPRVPHDQDPSQRHDRHGPERQRGSGRASAGDRRGGGRAGADRPARGHERDAEELEPPVQAQPGQDEDR